jgi:hypothetical protein
MPTYPSGEVLPAGAINMLDGTDPNLRYTDSTGTFKFRLLGGEMPWPGIQNGIVCTEWPRNMSPPFKHLDLQAAQQDGVTWTATVYEPTEVILPLEAHGNTPRDISRVVSEWIGAWDPKSPGLLEYFTFDRGYWKCNPRLSKVWQDQIKQSPRRHLRQKITHAFRIDNAFWSSISSTSTFQLGPSQIVTVTGNPSAGTVVLNFLGETVDIAVGATASVVQTGLEALSTVGSGNVIVGEITNVINEVGTLASYAVTFVNDLATTAVQLTADAIDFVEGVIGITPGVQTGVQGFVPLTNIGSEDGWPSYLCYAGSAGGVTFGFGNGPSTNSMVTFGPLEAGQVVVITTMPRLRQVKDVTQNLPAQALTAPQQFLEQLVDLISGVSGSLTVGETESTTGIPPLLTWFESLFGISPPQGNLYALLNGRFTTPISGVPQPFMAETAYIPVSITGGNADSKIIASITPQRRWPE